MRNINSSERAANLPISALLALTMSSFIATANEAVPAGLLQQIAQGLEVSEAWAGQLVTLCALGSGLAAIPLTLALGSYSRRLLLLWAIGGFLVCNVVTALSPYFVLTLAARLLVGVATGLAWSLLAGYARRMVNPAQQGRAMALAMFGIPLALALGVPLSAWLGGLVGWRSIFAMMAGLSLLLLVWVVLAVPDYPGQAHQRSKSLRKVLAAPGVRPILLVIVAWILAHYTLYTYIGPFLAAIGIGERLDVMLLIFGIASVLGIWLTGILVDRWLRALVLLSLAAFSVVALTLGINGVPSALVYAGIAMWGLSFSGAPTLLQTALADAAGEEADLAQAILVAVFNLAFAGSGILGGVLLTTLGARAIPWVTLALLLAGFLIAWHASRHGFKPGGRQLASREPLAQPSKSEICG